MRFYDNCETERLAANIRAVRTIMPDVLARERELATSKWFAYRFMSPFAATQLFADLYRKGVKRYVREHRDIEQAQRANGIADNIFSNPSGSLTQLWQARQRADELRLPYDLLIDFGFYFASRRRWNSTPRPIQLFGSKKSSAAWPLEMEKYLMEHHAMALNDMPILPQYQVENYERLAVQDDIREYLLDHVNNDGSNWSTKIANACVNKRHLPLLAAIKLAPETERRAIVSALRQEMNFGIAVSPPVERVNRIAFAPACLGISAARDDSAGDCQECPFNASCRSLADMAAQQLIDLFGTASPLADLRRERARLSRNARQQKFRDRKKIVPRSGSTSA